MSKKNSIDKTRPHTHTPEEMARLVEQYFIDGARTVDMPVKVGGSYEIVSVRRPGITDLMLYLGFTSRSSFYKLAKKPEYKDILNKARLRIVAEYEMHLLGPYSQGAKFALASFGGWSEGREHDDEDEKGDKGVILMPTRAELPPASTELIDTDIKDAEVENA